MHWGEVTGDYVSNIHECTSIDSSLPTISSKGSWSAGGFGIAGVTGERNAPKFPEGLGSAQGLIIIFGNVSPPRRVQGGYQQSGFV